MVVVVVSERQTQSEKDAKFQAEEAKKKWKMDRCRPPMDFMKAKLTLGINPAKESCNIDMEEIHKRFVTKSTMVSSDKNKGFV